MKLNQITQINGKKLSKSQVNLLAKLHSLNVDVSATEPEVRSNPYSGVSHTLDPIAAAIHDFIILQYRAGNVGKLFTVGTWDRARYFFLHFWPTEFYDLID